VQPSARARTKENNTEANLVKSLRSLRAKLSSIKLNASHRKPSQVHASHGQTESQVIARFHLVITQTWDFVWQGL